MYVLTLLDMVNPMSLVVAALFPPRAFLSYCWVYRGLLSRVYDGDDDDQCLLANYLVNLTERGNGIGRSRYSIRYYFCFFTFAFAVMRLLIMAVGRNRRINEVIYWFQVSVSHHPSGFLLTVWWWDVMWYVNTIIYRGSVLDGCIWLVFGWVRSILFLLLTWYLRMVYFVDRYRVYWGGKYIVLGYLLTYLLTQEYINVCFYWRL